MTVYFVNIDIIRCNILIMKVIEIIFLCSVIVVAYAGLSCPNIPGVGTLHDGEGSAGPLGECTHYRCDDGVYTSVICPTLYVDAPCKEIPGDPTRRYPECCPQSRCPYK
ncbi:uncharacterized protein [Diabrotica undecimpunctata]|uniref:uncharacterized protein n=1 Tax=Diabrotica undecimpunctata TaxID=50387 RepID=UPI003B633849